MLNQPRWHHEHTWPPEPGNVQQARRFVSDLLRAHGLGRVEVETLMVVSELATNAVVHARTTFSVGVAYANCTLTISTLEAWSPLSNAVPETPGSAMPATMARQ